MDPSDAIDRYARDNDERSAFRQMLGLDPTLRGRRCGSCGGKMRADNKYGFCTRYPQCRRIHQRYQFRVLNGVVSPYKD